MSIRFVLGVEMTSSFRFAGLPSTYIHVSRFTLLRA
jgi:hypothetical protein